MKQVKVYILDDDSDAVSRMEYLLKSIPQVKICGSETDSEQAVHQIKSNRPEIIFLDIEMPGKGGFDLLESVREKDYSPAIVFVTGHPDYAIKAIKESVLDYLLKPVDKDELNRAIDKYISDSNLSNPNTDKLIKDLTEREKEIFELLRCGNTSKQISLLLNISKNTVDTHRRRILKKLNIDSTTFIHLNYPITK